MATPYEIMPAQHTPRVVAHRDLRNGMPIVAAIKLPVQAPVPGNGRHTKKANPQNEYRSIRARFASTLANNQFAHRLHSLIEQELIH